MLTIQINGCAAIAWLAKPCYQNLHGEHCSNALASAYLAMSLAWSNFATSSAGSDFSRN